MVNLRLFSLIVAAFLTLAAQADEAAPPALPTAPEPPTAVVPYDPALPLDGQRPSRMYLDFDTFQRLWASAKENQSRAAAQDQGSLGDRAATVSSALHSARVEGSRLVAEARFSVLTRGPDWVVVPFAWAGASARTITVDGSPAALRDGNLIIEKPGAHTVIAQYEVPLPAGWTEVGWSVPTATATSLALRLAMEDPARPEINGGVPVVESTDDRGRVFTAMLGRTDRVVLRRQLSAARAGGVAGDPPLFTSRERLFVTSALERLEARATFTFAGQERRSFSLHLDPTLTPVSIDIPGLKTWSMQQRADARVLDFELIAPVRDAFSLNVVAERAVTALPASLSFPILSAAAGRSERETSFLVTGDLELRPQPDAQWRQIPTAPLTDEESGGFVPVATFAGSHHASGLPYSVRARAINRLATTSYVFQVGPGKFEIIAGLQLRHGAGEDLLEATIRIPDGLTVQGVAGERLTDWWREGDALRLRFSGATPDVTAVTLNLTRSLPAEATSVLFAPLAIDGFAKIDGTGLLIAPLGTATALAFDQPVALVRETAPEAANRGFTVLLPFEIKRGFTFDAAGWTATVQLSPIVAQFDADWVLDAEVHDGFVAFNANLLVSVRQGALNSVSFTLPSSLPELEVHGDDLREVTSVVDGTLRRYTAALQRETNSPLLFTLSGELGHSGQARLPDLDLPGATRIERFVIIENKSDGQLAVQRSGLTECPRGQLSFLPEALAESQQPAQFFSAQPGWSATVVLESLATTSGQAAVVLEADLTTSLLRNGEQWVRAVYRLHNRALQFLPVALPAGAQLVSVMVAAEPARADVGVLNGIPVTLIPLIQTRPGERSVEVSLVYRLPGPPPVRGVFERALDDPDLPGLSVQQTLWTVQLPDGFKLRHATGSMTRIEADSWDAEKWLGRLAESASLISLSSNRAYDAQTKEEALANSSELLSELQGLEKSGRLSQRAQGAYAQIAEELKKQQVQLTENRAQVAMEKSTAPPVVDDTRGQPDRGRKNFTQNNIQLVAPQPQAAPDLQLNASQLAINDNVLLNYPSPTTPSESPAPAASAPPQRRHNQLDKLSITPATSSPDDAIQAVLEMDQASGIHIQAETQTATQTSRPEPQNIEVKRDASDLNKNFFNSRTTGAQSQSLVPTPAQVQAPSAQQAAPPPIQDQYSPPQNSAGSPPPTAAKPATFPAALLTSHTALAEAFPSQSNAVHFKKIKDRASIHLVAAEPRLDRPRLTHAGIFAGLVALVLLGDRCRLRLKSGIRR